MLALRPGRERTSSGHNDIYLQRHQFGRENLESLGISLGGSDFDKEVATFDVPEVPQSLTEALKQKWVGCRRVRIQVAYSSDHGRLLRLGDRSRDDKTTCEGVNKRSSIHH